MVGSYIVMVVDQKFCVMIKVFIFFEFEFI